jgi:hypothetical protein
LVFMIIYTIFWNYRRLRASNRPSRLYPETVYNYEK